MVAAYVHNAASPELGKIGVLVALKSTADKDKLAALGKQLAMHVAAAAPLALTPEHLPKDVVERERAIQADIARQSGKPENVIEKMMEGRMRKFYEETVLLSADLRHRRRNPDRQGDREGRPRISARRSRSKALSASRWARASRRSTAISPTKSAQMAGPLSRRSEVAHADQRRNTAGSCSRSPARR